MKRPAPTPDSLHRTAKVFLDTGTESVEAAYDRLVSFRMAVHVAPEAACSRAGQAAVLTAVNAGARCLLGGVTVSGALDVPVAAPLLGASTLADAVVRVGGSVGGQPPDGTPLLTVGGERHPLDTDLALAAAVAGWNGGVVPGTGELHPDATPLAGVAAGALAVSEVFQHLGGFSSLAGRRPAGLALWSPDEDWRAAEPGPPLDVLPSRLWIVGLGHLGQAYLWTLGLLPYADPSSVELVLQDADRASDANRSTSPLTFDGDIGRLKTRLAAGWAEHVGFRTTLVERRLDEHTRRQPPEPALALFGVDNVRARSLAESVGFSRIIDAGLGSGATDFLSFQINGFPGPDAARDVWAPVGDEELPEEEGLPLAYRSMIERVRQRGSDACGVVRMAGVAVGAAFVGLATSALAIAEAVRLSAGESGLALLDGTLDDPAGLASVPADRPPALHLGFTEAELTPRQAA